MVISRLNRYRLCLWLSLILIIPIGYLGRFYLPAELEWLRNLVGNIAYEMFWILLVLILFPRLSPTKAAIGVCLASFGIEFLQLWQPARLQAIRATLLGRLVLGNSFFWGDFPQYGLGSAVGWLWANLLLKLNHPKRRIIS
jgi:glycopeptide antibiotics resistance protein